MEIKNWTLVTGATGAMGAAAVEALASQGVPVLLACRNLAKGEALIRDIQSRIPEARLEIRELELSSMESVCRLARSIEPGSVSALFNNAGVIPRQFTVTSDGLESSFAVNYFGPWLLTRLLAPKMAEGSRIVNMVSLTCRFAKVSADSLQPGTDRFSQLGTYARGKRAFLSFSMELARRYPALTVNVADPGVVASGMIDLGHWFDPLADALFKPFCSSPQKGVQPALRALEATKGPRYYVGEKQKPIPGRYQTPELDQELWEKTEQLIGGFFSPGSC